MDNKFTWIPFYKELSDWLLGKQNSQPELISTLKEIGITGFRDGTEKGKEITLQEIRSEEHTSELQSPDCISYAVFCLKKRFF